MTSTLEATMASILIELQYANDLKQTEIYAMADQFMADGYERASNKTGELALCALENVEARYRKIGQKRAIH